MNSAVPNPDAFRKLMAPTKGQQRMLALLSLGMRTLSVPFPDLAARLSAIIFTSPRRYTPPRFEQEIAKSAENLTFTIPGHTLRAYAWGEGPVVLLVHGWEGRGAQLGRFMQPLVDAGYRVIALDGPAHGRSDGRRTNVVAFAESLPEVAAQIGDLHAIIAHSFGAAATVLALKQGLTAEKLVLIGMPDKLVHVIARYQFTVQLSDRVIARMLRHLEQHIGVAPEEIVLANTDPSQFADCLHIHDRDDIEVPYSECEAVSAAWENATHVTTVGLGHRRILKEECVAALVKDFVRGKKINATALDDRMAVAAK